ncbi:MAG: PocR ligand-binding domain-containing protein [Cyclobacteriaceae bacterium]|nr:PocR ligand-binding domain-containing protein [Cyclobacteriaceae bacterium]
MEALQEELVIEEKEIRKIMDLLSDLFSIRTSFIYAIDDAQYVKEIAGNNGNYQAFCILVQKELKHRCIACDRDKFREARERREPLLYQCYNGLYEMFSPLFIENHLVGYLHFGQVRAEDDFERMAVDFNLQEHSELSTLEEKYNAMKVIPKEKLILISALFQKFSELILKNKFIELRKAWPEHYLKKYIEENLSRPITVQSAALFINRSPSYVTHKFRKIYGESFHRFLRKARIQKAKKALMGHSIDETYAVCGFKNRYHFSKVFKQVTGMTPKKFQANGLQSEALSMASRMLNTPG